MPAITDLFAKASNGTAPVPTTLASQKSNGAASASISLATGWPTTTPVHGLLYMVDANNNMVAGTLLVWKGVLTGTTINNFTVKSGTDNVYAAGSVIELAPTSAWADDIITGITVDHDVNGHHKDLTGVNAHTVFGLTDVASAANNLRSTNAIAGAAPILSAEGSDANVNMILQGKGTGAILAALAGIQGQLINGQIVPSVATNNLTVTIKTMDNNTPSASNPVFIRIGNNIRSITAALSVTLNAGTNWFSKGAGYFASNESDFFVYLGWNTNTSAVQVAISSDPNMRLYSDFTTTNTNWNYFGGTGTAPASTDEFQNVGRFNAILGPTASFNWSLPGTQIILNKPTYETRIFSATNSGGAGGSINWQQRGPKKELWGVTNQVGTGNQVVNLPGPFFNNGGAGIKGGTVIANGPYLNTNVMTANWTNDITTETTSINITPLVITGASPSNKYSYMVTGI